MDFHLEKCIPVLVMYKETKLNHGKDLLRVSFIYSNAVFFLSSFLLCVHRYLKSFYLSPFSPRILLFLHSFTFLYTSHFFPYCVLTPLHPFPCDALTTILLSVPSSSIPYVLSSSYYLLPFHFLFVSLIMSLLSFFIFTSILLPILHCFLSSVVALMFKVELSALVTFVVIIFNWLQINNLK